MQKRKLNQPPAELTNDTNVDTSKPTAIYKPTRGRSNTLSLALPGSIIANAKNHDQKTYLAGSIARALAVFCVDEIVIFDDEPPKKAGQNGAIDELEKYTAFTNPNHFLAHVLTYLETPAYLRKHLFPMHPNLKTAGTLPSLDMPHHLRSNEDVPYREGVTVENSQVDGKTVVDVGLQDVRCSVQGHIPPNVRVTVRLEPKHSERTSQSVDGLAVAPTAPREFGGYYWGYQVRRCPSLSTVFTDCPFENGYDISWGLSERGEDVMTKIRSLDTEAKLPKYEHMLIVLGGVAGLEVAARNDPNLADKGITEDNVSELFDHWVNILPGQGSRTIRTEEAVWLGLMGLRSVVTTNG